MTLDNANTFTYIHAQVTPQQQQDVRRQVREAVVIALSPWRDYKSACSYLSVSRSFLAEKVRHGLVPEYRHGSSVRFKVEDLDKLFTHHPHA